MDLEEVVAGLCGLVGVALIGYGCAVGAQAAAKVKTTVDEVLKAQEVRISTASAQTFDGTAVGTVTEETAKSALEQIGGIVGSLPEHLRFAGLLVLVGTVLVSVATIQFGGTSLF
jgi:hypothetical protein